MKTRLQLANGMLNGTLTKKEMAVAQENLVVMKEVSRLMFETQMEYDGGEHDKPKRRKTKHG